MQEIDRLGRELHALPENVCPDILDVLGSLVRERP
jgi:hypothetical protein